MTQSLGVTSRYDGYWTNRYLDNQGIKIGKERIASYVYTKEVDLRFDLIKKHVLTFTFYSYVI